MRLFHLGEGLNSKGSALSYRNGGSALCCAGGALHSRRRGVDFGDSPAPRLDVAPRPGPDSVQWPRACGIRAGRRVGVPEQPSVLAVCPRNRLHVVVPGDLRGGGVGLPQMGPSGHGKVSLQLHGGLDKLSLWFFGVVVLAYAGVAFIYALAPEVSPDGVGYHLGLVRRYHNDHGFSAMTTSIYAFLSQGAEMLYLFAYSVGRHSAAKLVHFSFLIATVLALLCFGRRFNQPTAAFVAAILYLCAPVVGILEL